MQREALRSPVFLKSTKVSRAYTTGMVQGNT